MDIEQFTAGVSAVTLAFSVATFVVVFSRNGRSNHALGNGESGGVKNNGAHWVFGEGSTGTTVFSPSQKNEEARFRASFE